MEGLEDGEEGEIGESYNHNNRGAADRGAHAGSRSDAPPRGGHQHVEHRTGSRENSNDYGRAGDRGRKAPRGGGRDLRDGPHQIHDRPVMHTGRPDWEYGHFPPDGPRGPPGPPMHDGGRFPHGDARVHPRDGPGFGDRDRDRGRGRGRPYGDRGRGGRGGFHGHGDDYYRSHSPPRGGYEDMSPDHRGGGPPFPHGHGHGHGPAYGPPQGAPRGPPHGGPPRGPHPGDFPPPDVDMHGQWHGHGHGGEDRRPAREHDGEAQAQAQGQGRPGGHEHGHGQGGGGGKRGRGGQARGGGGGGHAPHDQGRAPSPAPAVVAPRPAAPQPPRQETIDSKMYTTRRAAAAAVAGVNALEDIMRLREQARQAAQTMLDGMEHEATA